MKKLTRVVRAWLPHMQRWLSICRWPIFGLLILAFGYPELQRANHLVAERFTGVTDTEAWKAASFWLESAECMRRTGAWLVICREGALSPIANYALADDPGHALLLGITAWAQDRTMTILDIARLNNAIDFFAMACLAALLWAARSYIASAVFLALGGFTFFVILFYSPHPASIGAASFAALLPMGLVLSRTGYLNGAAHIVVVAGGLLLLAVAALLREPVGIMGFLVSLGTLAFLGWRHPRPRELYRLFPMLVLLFVAWQTPRWVLFARDQIFAIPVAQHVQTHGISHNLYLGLGSVENSFGIRWDDSLGMAAASKTAPNVRYVSDEYFKIMWKLYFERVASDPIEVARIYAVKAGKILSLRLPDDGWMAVWLECAITGFLLLIAGPLFGVWRQLNYGQAPILMSLGLVFTAFFVLQGILADISIVYAYPIGVFVLLFASIRGEMIVRCILWILARFVMLLADRSSLP